MTMLSMSTSDLANCSLRLSSETILRRFASCAARSVAWRFSAIWRAVRSSDATRKRSPAVGTDVRPSTCTGVDGVASFMWLPFSSSMARTRPYEVPATMASPMRRVPCCTSTVATAPRPLSSRASTVAPRASISGFARRSRSASAVSSTASSSLSTLVPCLAEMSTNMVSPPYSSGTRPNSVSWPRTFSGFAPGLSILLTATTIGTLAACAWLMASTVCGITPSSAATTRIATSVSSAPRARMAVNASWPGVSRNVILRFSPSRSTVT